MLMYRTSFSHNKEGAERDVRKELSTSINI